MTTTTSSRLGGDPMTTETGSLNSMGTDLLEQILSADSLQCRANHAHINPDGCEPCTKTVVAMGFSCVVPHGKLICQSAANYMAIAINDSTGLCADCARLASQCWRVVAI